MAPLRSTQSSRRSSTSVGGTPAANRAMMNFDTGVAKKSTTYFGYCYTGTTKGCYTNRHGENHNPHTY